MSYIVRKFETTQFTLTIEVHTLKVKSGRVGHRTPLKVTLFLSGSPQIQNWSPNQNLGTPTVGSQNGP